MMKSNFSLLVVKKESNITSFSSLGYIKKVYKGQKVGHTGTLDKFASGLMIVLTGEATKINPIFSSMDKTYRAIIKFGEETDTLDPEGQVVKTSSYLPTEEELKIAVSSFLGKQKQIPPIYSAIHINGKRAYQSARSGDLVDMPERDIEVFSIELLSYKDNLAEILVHVSKGTYIRSIARDLAYKANTVGHLVELERLTVGPYTYDNISEIPQTMEETLKRLKMLPNINELIVKDDAMHNLLHGYISGSGVLKRTSNDDGYYLTFEENDNFLGIIEQLDGKLHIRSLTRRG